MTDKKFRWNEGLEAGPSIEKVCLAHPSRAGIRPRTSGMRGKLSTGPSPQPHILSDGRERHVGLLSSRNIPSSGPMTLIGVKVTEPRWGAFGWRCLQVVGNSRDAAFLSPQPCWDGLFSDPAGLGSLVHLQVALNKSLAPLS